MTTPTLQKDFSRNKAVDEIYLDRFGLGRKEGEGGFAAELISRLRRWFYKDRVVVHSIFKFYKTTLFYKYFVKILYLISIS